MSEFWKLMKLGPLYLSSSDFVTSPSPLISYCVKPAD